LLALAGLAIIGIYVFTLYKEWDRMSSISQLLKKLPLKDRMLGRVPENFLEEPLSLPVSPSVPFGLVIAVALITSAAIGNIIVGIVLYMFTSTLSQFSIPRTSQLFSILPFYGIFLLLATILIVRKHNILGAIIL